MKVWFFALWIFWVGTCSAQMVQVPTSLRAKLTEEGVALVDVRKPEQFAESPVEKAVNIPLSELESHLDFFRAQKAVVLFCNTGNQSGQAFAALKAQGLTHIYDAKTWRKVYQAQRLKMNLLATDYPKERPLIKPIRSDERMAYFAVALGKGGVLEKHKTETPAVLVVLKGKVAFGLDGDYVVLEKGDVYDIPVGRLHEVRGLGRQNLFTVCKTK
ncbi:rhodanese-like domain-containing protein [Bergeyella sp. RCAD1439]|uniref:rhodanese-like domain-containing protein n=1 Tax=Bergeyella anatis TaxID=3113737 RepID=UPI002E18E27E|nr:rhodanese-like domain-containing protein [Bergeyella sp. RCAD1439]